MLAGSVLDTDWFDTVVAAPGPYLFVCEAVFVYLTRNKSALCRRSLLTGLRGL